MFITNEFAIRGSKRSKDRTYPHSHPTLEATYSNRETSYACTA